MATKIPAIPDPGHDPARVLKALKEIVEVREGLRGDPLDAFVSYRNLKDYVVTDEMIVTILGLSHGHGASHISAGTFGSWYSTTPGTYTFPQDLVVSGKVGIGTATVPHGGIGAAKLAIDGTQSSVSAGPHIQLTTDEDNYPLLQILGYVHNSGHISFDAYFDGAWRSGYANTNFLINKTTYELCINGDAGIAQGSVISLNRFSTYFFKNGYPQVGIERWGWIGPSNDDAYMFYFGYSHDNVAFCFDAYWAGAWYASDPTCFAVYKYNDRLSFAYTDGAVKGSTFSWNWDAICINSTGLVGIGVNSVVSGIARLEVEDGGTSAGILVKITQDDAIPWALAIGNDTYSATDTAGLKFRVDNTGYCWIEASGTVDTNILCINTELGLIFTDNNGGSLIQKAQMTWESWGCSLYLGTNDTGAGALWCWGSAPGSIYGGAVILYNAADHDTTVESYTLQAIAGNLVILDPTYGYRLTFYSAYDGVQVDAAYFLLYGGTGTQWAFALTETANTFRWRASTGDGADNQIISICSGGGQGATRGAYVSLGGNESGLPGQIYIVSGDAANNAIYFYTSGILSASLFTSGGAILALGENDTTFGQMSLYGHGTGTSQGGRLQLYLAADYDTTIALFNVQSYEDDLLIGLDTDPDALKLNNAKDLYLTDGDAYFQLGGATKITLDATNTRLGLGVAPSYQLHGTLTTGNVSNIGWVIDYNADNTAYTQTRAKYAVWIDMDSDTNADGHTSNLVAFEADHTATGVACGGVWGVRSMINLTSAGAVTALYGYQLQLGISSTGAATHPSVYGWDLITTLSNDTITTFYGVNISLVTGASGGVTTGYGFKSYIHKSGAGTFGTGYLFYGSYGTRATEPWGLYITNEGKNYLSASLLIGTTSVLTSLVGGLVIGNGTAASAVLTNAVGLWCEDINGSAGQAGLHMMAESQSVALVVAGVQIKGTTGDPNGHESKICINTSDNNLRIYAEGAWRQLTSWTTKTLTDASATGIFEVAIASGERVGGVVEYSISVTDGTDHQIHTGILTFAAVNKAGTITTDIDEVYLAASETKVTSSGTLTDAWTITTGASKITINCNADSSLGSPTLTLYYTVRLNQTNAVTPL
jgi:hypothetical protein